MTNLHAPLYRDQEQDLPGAQSVPLSTLLTMKNQQLESDLFNIIYGSHVSSCIAEKRDYEVNERSSGTVSNYEPQPCLKLLLEQATLLCNDLDELIALHYCFYEAVEKVHNCKELKRVEGGDNTSTSGVSLFPSWLRERDFTVLDAMHTLQQSLREVVCKVSECNSSNN